VRISQPTNLIRPDNYFKPTRQRYILTLPQNKMELSVFCVGFRFKSVKQETEKWARVEMEKTKIRMERKRRQGSKEVDEILVSSWTIWVSLVK